MKLMFASFDRFYIFPGARQLTKKHDPAPYLAFGTEGVALFHDPRTICVGGG